jgi:hypothetical protein
MAMSRNLPPARFGQAFLKHEERVAEVEGLA